MEKTINVIEGNLVDGDGNILKPEFGNPDHIAAIRKHERMIEELNSKEGTELDDVDFDVETTVTATAKFLCPCGQRVKFVTTSNDEDDEHDLGMLDDERKVCSKCGTLYHLRAEAGNLFVRAINKKKE